ncbi:hypothetical protein Aab01nite_43910 [Paractinoplanes abujensis]|nr:hypothetical protein Aab01nite_43910 [Actinoplanes abujensis]
MAADPSQLAHRLDGPAAAAGTAPPPSEPTPSASAIVQALLFLIRPMATPLSLDAERLHRPGGAGLKRNPRVTEPTEPSPSASRPQARAVTSQQAAVKRTSAPCT